MDKTTKIWYLILRAFWLLLSKFNYWKEGSIISFGNSWNNSSTKFVILDIKCHFTWGFGSVLNYCKAPKHYDWDCCSFIIRCEPKSFRLRNTTDIFWHNLRLILQSVCAELLYFPVMWQWSLTLTSLSI